MIRRQPKPAINRTIACPNFDPRLEDKYGRAVEHVPLEKPESFEVVYPSPLARTQEDEVAGLPGAGLPGAAGAGLPGAAGAGLPGAAGLPAAGLPAAGLPAAGS